MNPVSITSFFHDSSNTYSYLVTDNATKSSAIIDSVLDYDAAAGVTSTVSVDGILRYAEQQNVKLQWILETHVHADHLSAASYVRERSGAAMATGREITTVQSTFKQVFGLEEFVADGSQFDLLLADDEAIPLGASNIRVMHTPGHTPSCVTFVVNDSAAFVGDTIFMPDMGTARCDFPGGDAEILYASIQKILELPPETELYMCHDYGPNGRECLYKTTVAEQKQSNIHVHDGSAKYDFIAMRQQRDATLAMPALLLPAVQINIRGGRFPEPENNGVSYLKTPLNVFKK
ncbi:MBL fold metallo-hydrolase [Vibrio superstes]|uniref:MBL fold metallo-hydrolase n=1 Tax=Vibrio superstes NBRC 103154 TaxID=1219062 RepID=A0A511QWC5_9VIBR|nr:MBL fold metallo-hydrolase [Vibrio superstes]GEM80872.1 MBL fold metallo-hydrolase [Vibrio superstes NBRC 103154]